jgi:hypothetical protein
MACKNLRCLVLQIDINVSEELSASIFRAKDFSVVQMEAAVSSEKLVHIYQTGRCHSPEYSRRALHVHHRENLRCYRRNVSLKCSIK